MKTTASPPPVSTRGPVEFPRGSGLCVAKNIPIKNRRPSHREKHETFFAKTAPSQALACGTPVVTAGALQSVHRLAEGMVVAAAAAKRRCEKRHEPGGNVDSAGQPPTAPLGFRVPGAGARPGMGQPVDDKGAEEHHRVEGSCADTATRHSAACAGEDNHAADARDLVDNLVSATTREYVGKAVAVAAPGPLRESVRRALCGGREGMLRGDGDSVAADWERFLKNAAASASSPWERRG